MSPFSEQCAWMDDTTEEAGAIHEFKDVVGRAPAAVEWMNTINGPTVTAVFVEVGGRSLNVINDLAQSTVARFQVRAAEIGKALAQGVDVSTLLAMSNRDIRAFVEAHPSAKPGHPQWARLMFADGEIRRRANAGQWYASREESDAERDEVLA